MNLVHRLAEQASLHPKKTAIIDANRSINYEQLWRRVEGGADFLHQVGLKESDFVLVLHPITIELYELLLSCFHAGVTVVLIDPAKGVGFLNDCLGKYPPAAFLASPKAHLLRLKSSELRKAPLKIHTGRILPFTKSWKPSSEARAITELAPDTPALITFTSGSTGQPKGVSRSHQFLLAQDTILSTSLNLVGGQVDLVTLPVFLLSNLSHGLTSVIADTDLTNPRAPNVAKISAQCRNHKINRCTASPAFFEAMPKDLFEEVYTGGAPVFPDLLCQLPKNSHLVYGSSEAEPISHFPATNLSPRIMEIIKSGGGLPAGKPVEEIDLAIIEDKHGTPLSSMSAQEFHKLQNDRGEIVVSGDHVLTGYLGGHGDSENKFSVDGKIWHRTGDAGRLDNKGNLWLLGRCHAKWKEHYPLQIEAAVRAIVPGKKCAFWKGLLVLESSVPQLESQLEQFDLNGVIVIEKIPMDSRHNAKIDYQSLEKLLQQKNS